MKKVILSIFIIALIEFQACKEDVVEPDEHNHQELITTVNLIFTDSATQQSFTFTFSDPDGVGGNNPEIDTIKLAANSTYACMVEFLDESDDHDVEDVTEQVLEEGAEHHLCFAGLDNLGINMTFDEAENNNFPIPVNSTMRTGAIDSGQLTVTLKHQEGGLSHTDCDEGETDVEVTFEVNIN